MGNLYKDADKRRRRVPGGAVTGQDAKKEEKVVVTPQKEEKPVSEPVEAKMDALEELFTDIGANKKPTKRGSTLYLSTDVIDELAKRSKSVGLSSSEFLDQMLRRAFKL